MMLCDELCLKEELLIRAVNAFQAFRESYKGGHQLLPHSTPRPVRVVVPLPRPVKEDKSLFGRGWAWLSER